MFGKAWEDSEEHLSVIRSGGLGDVGLHIVGLKLHSVIDLLADLLGEGELDGGAGGGGDHGDALLDNSDSLLNLGDGDASLRDNILAGDDGQVNGLVDTDLLGLGIGNGDSGLDGGDDGDVVASLLGDLLAVVFSISMSVHQKISNYQHNAGPPPCRDSAGRWRSSKSIRIPSARLWIRAPKTQLYRTGCG